LENPNAKTWAKATISSPNCDKLNPLPGLDFLASGYDPVNAERGETCTFDQCRTRPIFNWKYEHCRTTHTPAGTFKVPDQVLVLPKYETTAHTKIYQNEEEFESGVALEAGLSALTQIGTIAAAAKFGKSAKEGKSKHLAERKVNVQLYTIAAYPRREDINEEFWSDLMALPLKFSYGSRKYFEFLQKYGRFTVDSAAFGGTLVLDMLFETAASDNEISAGVEAALDTIYSVSMQTSNSFNQRAAALAADSEISIEANGGDPSIASAITDLNPATKNSATFRTDFISWIQSVPLYPRLINTVPKLSLITHLLPLSTPGLTAVDHKAIEQDKADWRIRKWSMTQAMEVIAVSPFEAMRSHQKTCRVPMSYQDFDRFGAGSCLFMGVRTPMGFTIELAFKPGSDLSKLRIHVGTQDTYMETWTEAHGWQAIWKTDDPQALALSDGALLGKFWVCLTAPGVDKTHVTMGSSDVQFMEETLDVAIRPKYFGLKCDEAYGGFSDIMVIPVAHFKYFVDPKQSFDLESDEVCEFTGCIETEKGPPCRCTKCETGLVLVDDPLQRSTPCKPGNWEVTATSVGNINSVNQFNLSPNSVRFVLLGAYRWRNLEKKNSVWSTSSSMPLDYAGTSEEADDKNLLNTCAARAKAAGMPAFCVKKKHWQRDFQATDGEKIKTSMNSDWDDVCPSHHKVSCNNWGMRQIEHVDCKRQGLLRKNVCQNKKGFCCKEMVEARYNDGRSLCMLPKVTPEGGVPHVDDFKTQLGTLGQDSQWQKSNFKTKANGGKEHISCYAITTERGQASEIAFDDLLTFRKYIPDAPEVLGWRFAGDFFAPEDNDYEFCVNSADGSAVYVDGHQVEVWDGNHGMGSCDQHKGTMTLSAGYHQIEVKGFHVDGAIGQKAKWRKGNSGPFKEIPVFKKTW